MLSPDWRGVEKELLYEFVYGVTPVELLRLVRMWEEKVRPFYADILEVAFGASGGASS